MTKSSSKRRASKASSARKRSASRGKVGSDPKALRRVGGKGDFGAPEAKEIERNYVSNETRHNDPGAAPSRLKDRLDDPRESGVGAPDSGPGSGSGGDLDTDIVGVGFGGSGVAQSGPTRTEGADITTTGGSEPFAAPGPKGHPDKNPRRTRVRGSTVDHSGGDVTTTGDGQSSGSVSESPVRNDDSFAGDINFEEIQGGDNPPEDNRV